MARPPIPQIQEVALRPTAAPVDTFVKPARNRLLDVAESLAPIDRGLQEFFEQRNAKQAADDGLRSEAAFYSGSEPALAEGIRTGKIPPQYSPAFVRGYKNAQGNVAGGQLRQKYNEAFDAWEGKNSDDPEAYDKFLGDFLKGNLGTEDPDVLKGLLPAVKEIQANGRSRYIEYRAEQTYNGSLQTNVASANQAIDDADDAGLANEKGTDYSALWGNINKRREAFLSTGGKPEDFDKTMLDAIGLKVVEKQDPGLMKFFDQKVPGKDYTYADTPYGAKMKQATLENLEVISRRKTVEEDATTKAADKQAEEAATRNALEWIITDPTKPLPEGLIEQGTKAIPDFRAKVAQWQKNLNDVPTDARVMSTVTSDVINGGGEAAVIKAFQQGAITKREDVSSLLALAKSVTDNKDRITQALGSTEAKQISDALRIRTIGVNELGDPLPGMSNEGLEADYDFKRLLSEWVVRNPDASLQEQSAYIAQVGKSLLGNVTRPDEMEGKPGTYSRDPKSGFDNPYSDGTAPVSGADGDGPDSEDPAKDVDTKPTTGKEPTVKDQLDAQASGKAPAVTSDDPDVAPFVERLQPDQRKAFEAAAQKQNLTVEQLAKKMLDGNPEQRVAYDPNFKEPEGATDKRAALFTEADATKLLDAAEQATDAGDVTVTGREAPILSLVKQHEADGNYNAVYGNSKSNVDLGQFTVDQILGQQQAAIRRGAPSTAIGGYQIKYSTLKGLKDSLGLTGSERFVPELQDQLGLALMEGRGLSRYLSGQMSKKAFALGLSQEWAALPNPNTGRSFYAGDGLNASRVSAREVYSALGFGSGSSAGANLDVGREASLDGFLDGDARTGKVAQITWAHPEQEAGVDPALKQVLGEVGGILGKPIKATSGHRDADHPAERSKQNPGSGQHVKGKAVDLDLSDYSDAERTELVRTLRARGVMRFISYTNSPNMLHVDLKDQRGDGKAYFMHDRSRAGLKNAPGWLKAAAGDVVEPGNVERLMLGDAAGEGTMKDAMGIDIKKKRSTYEQPTDSADSDAFLFGTSGKDLKEALAIETGPKPSLYNKKGFEERIGADKRPRTLKNALAIETGASKRRAAKAKK